MLARPALAAQHFNALSDRSWGRLAQPMGAGAAIEKTGSALDLVALEPFAHRTRANAYG